MNKCISFKSWRLLLENITDINISSSIPYKKVESEKEKKASVQYTKMITQTV